ncbi:hypothetical protein ACWCQ0_50795, partial [Streptomyces massasporeus]
MRRHPDLATLKLGIGTVGLSVTADTTGNLYARNPAGQAAFVSPAPMMWDSTEISATGSRTAGTARTAAAAGPEDPFEPGPGARDALMTTRVVGQSLEITPDRDLLTAPETVYPVFIDPSWAEGKRQNWTRVHVEGVDTGGRQGQAHLVLRVPVGEALGDLTDLG